GADDEERNVSVVVVWRAVRGAGRPGKLQGGDVKGLEDQKDVTRAVGVIGAPGHRGDAVLLRNGTLQISAGESAGELRPLGQVLGNRPRPLRPRPLRRGTDSGVQVDPRPHLRLHPGRLLVAFVAHEWPRGGAEPLVRRGLPALSWV